MSSFPEFETAYAIHQRTLKEPTLSTGCPLLDERLSGGLRKGLIELSGEAGSGKTTMGIQLAFQASLPPKKGGLGAKSLFISTNSVVNEQRINDFNSFYRGKHPNIDFTENLLLHKMESTGFEARKLVLQTEVPKVVKVWSPFFCVLVECSPPPPLKTKYKGVRLVIIDSIAAFFRFGTAYIARAKEMHETANIFREIANEYNVIFIFINDVSDVFPTDLQFTRSMRGSAFSSARQIKPALGLAWSNAIDTRLMLLKQISQRRRSETELDDARMLNMAAPSFCFFLLPVRTRRPKERAPEKKEVSFGEGNIKREAAIFWKEKKMNPSKNTQLLQGDPFLWYLALT